MNVIDWSFEVTCERCRGPLDARLETYTMANSRGRRGRRLIVDLCDKCSRKERPPLAVWGMMEDGRRTIRRTDTQTYLHSVDGPTLEWAGHVGNALFTTDVMECERWLTRAFREWLDE